MPPIATTTTDNPASLSVAITLDTLRRARKAADLVQGVFADATIEVSIQAPDPDLTGGPGQFPQVEVYIHGDSGGTRTIWLYDSMTSPTMAREIGRAAALATLNKPARDAIAALGDD